MILLERRRFLRSNRSTTHTTTLNNTNWGDTSKGRGAPMGGDGDTEAEKDMGQASRVYARLSVYGPQMKVPLHEQLDYSLVAKLERASTANAAARELRCPLCMLLVEDLWAKVLAWASLSSWCQILVHRALYYLS